MQPEFQLSAPEAAPQAAPESSDLPQAYQTQTGRNLKDKNALDKEVSLLFKEICDVEPKSPEASALQQKIRFLGQREIKRLSDANNSFMSKMLKTNTVDAQVEEFKKLLEFLNPYTQKESKSSFMKMLSVFTPKEVSIKDKYKETEKLLDSVIQSLYVSKYQMVRDNVAIEVEKEENEESFDKIEGNIYMVRELTRLTESYTKKQNADYKKYLQDDFLFYLKQRQMDILESLGVNIQSYLSMEVVRRNNQEVIEWIERTGNVSLIALKNALLSKSQEEFNEKARMLMEIGDALANLNTQAFSIEKLAEAEQNVNSVIGHMSKISDKIKEKRIELEASATSNNTSNTATNTPNTQPERKSFKLKI